MIGSESEVVVVVELEDAQKVRALVTHLVHAQRALEFVFWGRLGFRVGGLDFRFSAGLEFRVRGSLFRVGAA